MADKKISALAAASTPLAGTEVFPIVQSSTTVKATIANVQAAPIAAQTANTVLYLNGTKVPSTTSNLGFDGTSLAVGASTVFYGGRLAVGGHIAIATGNSLKLWNTGGTGLATLTSTGTNGLTIAASGNTTLSDGNLVIGTAGKGIDFTQDPNPAGMTSELLDDYEEGTWTPVVTAGSGTITTVGTVVGRYTKIGNQVTVWGTVAVTNNGTGAVYLNVTGVPFSPAATVFSYTGAGTNANSAKMINAYLSDGGSILLWYYDATYPIATGQSAAFCISYFV
jgi:hypothetical protein